jgi:hypothetical protein
MYSVRAWHNKYNEAKGDSGASAFHSLSVSLIFSRPELNQKIPALPLQFDHLPVELLSKEFTKLNNPHPFRIHYLGPRFYHTLALHQRYAYNEEFKEEEQVEGESRSYPAPLRRIVNSNYMNVVLGVLRNALGTTVTTATLSSTAPSKA